LASKLTNWHIDVKSESRHERQKQEGYQALLGVRGLTVEMADRLYEAGITSLEFFVGAASTELQELTRLPEEATDELVQQARAMIEARGAESADQVEESLDQVEESAEQAESSVDRAAEPVEAFDEAESPSSGQHEVVETSEDAAKAE
jgi:N utilization substance protein A